MQAKINSLVRKGSFSDRKIFLFLGLILVTGIILWVQYSQTNETPQPTIQKSLKKNGSKDFDPLNSPDPSLPMAQLNETMLQDDGGKRNLFDYQAPPPPPQPATTAIQRAQVVPPPPPASVCGNRNCETGENSVNCPTDCQPPAPPVDNFNPVLKYIGYVSEGGNPIAFLTDGDEIYYGKINDIIANKYRVIKITDQSVELGNMKRTQSKTIQFQGNNPS